MATPQQQAQKLVEQILGPQIKSTQEQYRNQGAGLQAAYAALAKLNEGVAPAIQGTYNNASSQQAVIAKGYSDGFKQASEKSAFDANALLAQNGSPQQVTGAGEAGANALYGFGGAIPAGTLNQQGAAFTAAARFLPGQDRTLGIDALKSANIGGQAAVSALEAKRPELFQASLTQLQESERADKALAINKWYLENALRESGAKITGRDPLTGLPTADTTAATTAATTKAGEKAAAARAKAVAKRSDATVQSLGDTSDWIEKQLDADSLKVVGYEPVEGPTDKTDPDMPMPQWYTKGGGLTTNINDPDILKKPVYSPTAISKPAYNSLFGKVLGRLRRELGRYGYKNDVLRSMAHELMRDYYEIVAGQAANPTVKNPGSGPGSSPR